MRVGAHRGTVRSMKRPLAELLVILGNAKAEDVTIDRPAYPGEAPYEYRAKAGACELAVTLDEANDYFKLRGLE